MPHIPKDLPAPKIPKSRWTALKDKMFDVPINYEDILNTIELLSRTTKKAELIGVSLNKKTLIQEHPQASIGESS